MESLENPFYPTSSIQLVQSSPTKQYYEINVAKSFKTGPTKQMPSWCPPNDPLQRVVSFEIEGELNEIISALISKLEKSEFNICFNNCADLSAWFLEEFADIPNPSYCGVPLSCNWLGLCIMLPSFLQCCTLPGRVIDYTEHALKEQGLTKHQNGNITHYSGTMFSAPKDSSVSTSMIKESGVNTKHHFI